MSIPGRYVLGAIIPIGALAAAYGISHYAISASSRAFQSRLELIPAYVMLDHTQCPQADHPLSILVLNRNPMAVAGVTMELLGFDGAEGPEVYLDEVRSERRLAPGVATHLCWPFDPARLSPKAAGRSADDLRFTISVEGYLPG